ncbi:hypothetical protein ACIPSJ_30655 [Streptomyces sp. NPDC090088]|uniref:hypothetical protein n=1 Tax=Streptomyces sp. NPDC090088 TaxID=3365944 RepID=UPI0037F31EB0
MAIAAASPRPAPKKRGLNDAPGRGKRARTEGSDPHPSGGSGKEEKKYDDKDRDADGDRSAGDDMQLVTQDEEKNDDDGDFMAHIAVTWRGTRSADGLYPLDGVAVRSLLISDTDRGPTRFGKKTQNKKAQRSHTTAWTLLREALANLAGRPANVLVDYLRNRLRELSDTAKGWEEQPGAWDRARVFAEAQLSSAGGQLPLNRWAEVLTRLLRAYVSAYQLSPIATYADGQATGHGEPDAMVTLRQLENGLQSGGQLDDTDRKKAATAAQTLVDVKRGESLGQNYAHAVDHFWMTLATAFPLVTRQLIALRGDDKVSPAYTPKYGPVLDSVVETFAQPHVAQPSVTDTGVPVQLVLDELETGFLADVRVAPVATGGAEASAYAMNEVKLRQVTLSTKERPRTAFIEGQGSHRISFALGKRALESLAGHSVADAVEWLSRAGGQIADHPPVHRRSAWVHLREQQGKLLAFARTAHLPTHEWSELLSALVRGYSILHNAHLLAVGGGGAKDLGSAFGHGEAAHLRALAEAAAAYRAALHTAETASNRAARSKASAKATAVARGAISPALGLLDVTSLRDGIIQKNKVHLLSQDSGKATSKYQALLPEDRTVPASRWSSYWRAAWKAAEEDIAKADEEYAAVRGSSERKVVKAAGDIVDATRITREQLGSLRSTWEPGVVVDQWVELLERPYRPLFSDEASREALRDAAYEQLRGGLSAEEQRVVVISGNRTGDQHGSPSQQAQPSLKRAREQAPSQDRTLALLLRNLQKEHAEGRGTPIGGSSLYHAVQGGSTSDDDAAALRANLVDWILAPENLGRVARDAIEHEVHLWVLPDAIDHPERWAGDPLDPTPRLLASYLWTTLNISRGGKAVKTVVPLGAATATGIPAVHVDLAKGRYSFDHAVTASISSSSSSSAGVIAEPAKKKRKR